MNLETLDWDDRLLAAMRVPRTMLPRSADDRASSAATRDPVPGIAITAMIGDQQASLFGQTAFEAGEAKCTFGTGSFLLLNTGPEIVHSKHGLISTVAHKVRRARGRLRAGGFGRGRRRHSCSGAGTTSGLIRSPAEIETLAAHGAGQRGLLPGARVLGAVRAALGQRRAQGMLVGLTAYVTKAHIARAVLEATAWQTREVVDAMNADAGVPLQSLAVDGGMTGDNLLMQMIADVLDIPVVRPMMAETVALGAAYAAGLGGGLLAGPPRTAQPVAPRRRVATAHGSRPAGRRAGPVAPRRRALDRLGSLTGQARV